MTVHLNINALRKRAAELANQYADITSEKQHDQNFMRDFCAVFGISSSRIEWQFKVRKNKQAVKWVDGFIPGLLLMEMKSAGENLDDAYRQAAEYIALLPDHLIPPTVLVCDFQTLRCYLRKSGDIIEIPLADLPQRIDSLLFLAGYEAKAIEKQQQANEQAAEQLAQLHDAIKATGYEGYHLEQYLVRLLFCLFAEDTGLFGENGLFLDLLINHTRVDGSDLHGQLSQLFDTLNKPHEKRLKNLPEHLSAFPYINGSIFAGQLDICQFEEATRKTLIDCAKLDWSVISPAIFGSLFQAIMHFDDEAGKSKTKKRRELGAHYTSEANILKVIDPLFMDALREELARLKRGRNKDKLRAFHRRLSEMQFLDPACGCGNFLVIAYRELRLLELEVIEILEGKNTMSRLNMDDTILCNVDQFHGMEIDSSAAQIAKLALWLTDHQINLKVQRFGNYLQRIPLTKAANIVCGNALQLDWNTVLPAEKCSYVMGNPPFIGKTWQTSQQRADMTHVCKGMNRYGDLDYVAGWYVKSADYIKVNPSIPVAFVSTNSITQGEQVATLWKYLMTGNTPIHIHFAHRTFRWSNEGKGVAAVHCVIIGFGLSPARQPVIYDYGNNINGDASAINASHINPYLIDAPAAFIEKRRNPLREDTPPMVNGNKPTDGGHLLLSPQEAADIRRDDPIAAKYIRPFLGAEEFINGIERYCLWLKDSTASDRKASPEIQRRIESVKAMRLASSDAQTQKDAATPYLFQKIRQTEKPYLLIPSVSSEQRIFVPIGYLLPDVITSNLVYMLPNATLYHFGILCSTMHNTWMRTVCGRLKSDYSYSNTIVYNNFPWPDKPTEAQRKKISAAAQKILDERQAEVDRSAAQNQTCSLADLYAPGNMPADLLKAHTQLDKAVDAAYAYQGDNDEAARVAFLFDRYLKLTAPQPEQGG
ncbi:MAG: class I SAM-dependent DNA methyltransferase [Methylococcaceae bacterium]